MTDWIGTRFAFNKKIYPDSPELKLLQINAFLTCLLGSRTAGPTLSPRMIPRALVDILMGGTFRSPESEAGGRSAGCCTAAATGGTAWLCSTCFCFSCMSRTYRLQHTHTKIHSRRNMNEYQSQLCGSSWSVLRIRIRDPVPFWPLDPGSGIGKT